MGTYNNFETAVFPSFWHSRRASEFFKERLEMLHVISENCPEGLEYYSVPGFSSMYHMLDNAKVEEVHFRNFGILFLEFLEFWKNFRF
jgi:hypothetical protein